MTDGERTIPLLAASEFETVIVNRAVGLVPAGLFARSNSSCHGAFAVEKPLFVVTHETDTGCPARMVAGDWRSSADKSGGGTLTVSIALVLLVEPAILLT